MNINSITGEISSKNHCSNLNEVLIKCTDVSNEKKSAYAKLKFDQICQKDSIKRSNISWINKIGEDRRQRIHYQESPTPLVNFENLITIIFYSFVFRFILFVIVVNNLLNHHHLV